MTSNRKYMTVTAADMIRDDIVTQSPSGAFTYGGNFRTAKVNEYLTGIDGIEHRNPLGTEYRISREMTADEIAEREAEFTKHVVSQLRAATADPQVGLDAARNAFVEMMVKSNRPANEVTWRAADLAAAEGYAECWWTVKNVAEHAASEQGLETPTDEQMLVGVLVAVREVQNELLRGDYSRSTNPYSNAVDDDKRKAKAAWLRDHNVYSAQHAAKQQGIDTPSER